MLKRYLLVIMVGLLFIFSSSSSAYIGHSAPSGTSDYSYGDLYTDGYYEDFERQGGSEIGATAAVNLNDGSNGAIASGDVTEGYYTSEAGASWSYEAQCSIYIDTDMGDATYLSAFAQADATISIGNTDVSVYKSDGASNESAFILEYSDTISDSGTSTSSMYLVASCDVESEADIGGDMGDSGDAYAFAWAEWDIDMY